MATLCAAVALYAASAASSGPPAPPCLPPESAALAAAVPELVGAPLEAEHPADADPGALVQRTSTGLLYRSESANRPATFTNGWARARLGSDGELIGWAGLDLDPPPPPPAAPSRPPLPSAGGIQTRGGPPLPVSGAAWPIGGAVGARIYCVEGIESSHGRGMYNPIGLWVGGHVEHAQGWLGFLPSTARRWGASIGNRASEWQAAARMIAAGVGGQFDGILRGRC